ncbi:NUDIX domain-containing protein [soil metagenome]
MDEKIDVLDGGGEKTGRIVWKSEAHRAGLWHRCFHCWILSPETGSGGPYLFVQRRASGKETWPDRLDVTVGGHLGAGEEPLDGLREVEEELGLKVTPDELIPLGTRRAELQIQAGTDREFQDVFLLVRPLASNDLCLQEEEVAAVVSLRLADVEALCGGAGVRAEEWAGGETRSIQASLADFVPGEDGYLLRAARAARTVLGGRLPGTIF